MYVVYFLHLACRVVCIDDEFVAFNQFSNVSDPDSPPVDVNGYSNKAYGVSVASSVVGPYWIKDLYRTWKVTSDVTEKHYPACSYGTSTFLYVT